MPVRLRTLLILTAEVRVGSGFIGQSLMFSRTFLLAQGGLKTIRFKHKKKNPTSLLFLSPSDLWPPRQPQCGVILLQLLLRNGID